MYPSKFRSGRPLDGHLANTLHHTKKTEYMIIGSYQRLNLIETDPPIYLGTEKIKRVKTIKSLGLMLDETLSWNEQVNAITTKVNRGLNVLKRLREFVDLETLLIAYKTLVQPYFDYCSQVWGGIDRLHTF